MTRLNLLQRLNPELKQELENSERYTMSTEELFSELEKLNWYIDMPYIVYYEILHRIGHGTSAPHASEFFTASTTNP